MIYDLTQIFNELDLLEIRMNILDEYVDKFVIGESTQTFSGNKKPLSFKENENRFSKWKDKIIYVEIPEYEGGVIERTAKQKDYLRTALVDCNPEDTIYYGDVDEIWKPQAEEGKLRQLNYCYYLNQRSSEIWEGTNVCKFKNIRNLNELRADHSKILLDGGWHFTNQGGVEQIKKKIEAYDHQEFNRPDIIEDLELKIKLGEDYVGRDRDWLGKEFKFWIDESDLPNYVIINKQKYARYFK